MADVFRDYSNMPRAFGLIASDYPWSYEAWSERGQGRSADNEYPTLTMPEIRKIDPTPLLDPNGAFMLNWMTGPGMFDQHDYFISLGLKYITLAFVWLKQTTKNREWFIGNGHYTRANAEICCLYGWGDYKRVPHRLAIPQVVARESDFGQLSLWDALDRIEGESLWPPIVSTIGAHSAKPIQWYRRAEGLHNHMNPNRLELFARHRQPGWWSTGLDLDGLDIRDAIPMIQAGEYKPAFDRLCAPAATVKRGKGTKTNKDQISMGESRG
jgi:N6-adenosine-specific RNA methylase IME4